MHAYAPITNKAYTITHHIGGCWIQLREIDSRNFNWLKGNKTQERCRNFRVSGEW
jgi:hypothetical protein